MVIAGWITTAAAAAILSATTVAWPADQSHAFVGKWYDAQMTADESGLAGMIADDATFSVAEPSVKTKADFVRALIDWRATAGDGTEIRYEMNGTNGDVYQVLVCYIFPDSQAYSRETLRLRDGKVVAYTSEVLSDACDNPG